MNKKWLATIRVSWSTILAYRLSFFLQAVVPTLVFFFVRYSLWRTVYQGNPEMLLGGYSYQMMIEYQFWVFIVALLSQSYSNMSLANDIRMGRITQYLLYPFGFWEYQTSSFLAFTILQLFVATIAVTTLSLLGIVEIHAWADVAVGIGLTLGVAALWFSLMYTLGLMAFWMEEVWILRVITILVVSFLAGAVIPLELFPDGLRAALDWTPFPLMTYVPVRILMGTYDGSILAVLGLLGFWLTLSAAVAAVTWRRGIRLYTAAGI